MDPRKLAWDFDFHIEISTVFGEILQSDNSWLQCCLSYDYRDLKELQKTAISSPSIFENNATFRLHSSLSDARNLFGCPR